MIDLQDSSLPQKQRESSSNEGSITSLVDIKASHVAMRDLFTQIREAAGVTGEDENCAYVFVSEPSIVYLVPFHPNPNLP